MSQDMSAKVPMIAGLLLASWCVMVTAHETGHVVAGWLSGGTLRQAELAPWRLPYSIFDPDPRPLVTLWGGPLAGVLVPLLFAAVLRADWAWLIAHFCQLANGVYLATSWLSGDTYLDTARLLEHGASPISIGAFCLLTIAYGYRGFRQKLITIWRADTHRPRT